MKKKYITAYHFFNENKALFKNVKIGCSFSPEHAEWLIAKIKIKKITPLDLLKYIVEVLKIKHIRFGIRWNKIVKNGKFSFAYYKSFLDYLFLKKVKVCLNIGPIKTFRWPEDHVPIEIPLKKGESVVKNKVLSQKAIEYTNALLTHLKATYKSSQLKLIEIIQPENEPFQKFGKNKIKIDKTYLCKITEIITSHFPRAAILLNSMGNWVIHKIINFFKEIRKRKKNIRLILGYDYYYKSPETFASPILGKLDSPAHSDLLMWNTCRSNKKNAKHFNYDIEVTEAQLEPWGKYTSPGHSFVEFYKMLIRCIKKILLPEKLSLIRVWGIEHLALSSLISAASHDQKEILKLMSTVNL